jgi:hypothetical protein
MCNQTRLAVKIMNTRKSPLTNSQGGISTQIPPVHATTENHLTREYHIQNQKRLGDLTLHVAATTADTRMIRRLGAFVINVSLKTKKAHIQAVHIAAASGDTETMRALGEIGVNTSAQDSEGRTTMHLSAAYPRCQYSLARVRHIEG